MINSEIVKELRTSLTTKLNSTTRKTKILAEIDARIGTLSSPGKMPWYGWSISADHCNTGSKLAKIEGTPCAACYAMKGRYRFPNVKNALDKRLEGFNNDPDWWMLMAIRLNLLANKTPEHFRWFDSGDLQSGKMLAAIDLIAVYTPGIQHWLPTQERKLVAPYSMVNPPKNLTIRVSAAKLDSAENSFPNSSSVSTNHEKQEAVHQCPARQQGNKCGECRACWDRDITHVSYPIH